MVQQSSAAAQTLRADMDELVGLMGRFRTGDQGRVARAA